MTFNVPLGGYKKDYSQPTEEEAQAAIALMGRLVSDLGALGFKANIVGDFYGRKLELHTKAEQG